MFLSTSRSGYLGTEQYASGHFLILFSMNKEIRCLVRKVALRQCGQFMMGSVTVAGEYISLSGQYGGDGLPNDPPTAAFWERLHPLPDDIAADYWKSENGSAEEAIRNWAKTNRRTLSHLKLPSKARPKIDAPYKHLAKAIVLSDGSRLVHIRAGDLIEYATEHESNALLGMLLAQDKDKRLLILCMSQDKSYGYLRLTEEKSILRKIPPSDFAQWFFSGAPVDPQAVINAANYGSFKSLYKKE